MNKNITSPLTLFILLCLCSGAQSEPLLPSVVESLQHREQNLDHSEFKWHIDATEQHFGISQEKAQQMRKAGERDWEARYRQQGMTNKEQIHKFAQSATDSILMALVSSTVKYSSTWTFNKEGQATLVDGSVQSISNIVNDYIQLYNQNTMLLACNNSRLTEGNALRVEDPSVWQTAGESVRYPSPIPDGLDLAPEHFVMLTGITPLKDRGLSWDSLSVTPTSWTLKSQANSSSVKPGLAIVLTLSRVHANCPLDIQVKHFGWSEEFQAKSFRRYRNEWIIDNAVYRKSIPNLFNIYQVWHLQSVADGKTISVRLAHKNPVHDYRLLGPNLDFRKIMFAERQHSHDIVYYSWSGSIPDAQQFNKLYQKQHPGEGAPDVGQNGAGTPASAAIMIGSAMPFAGGALCLVGGVWMFKQRRAN